jgi:hypothetical protein
VVEHRRQHQPSQRVIVTAAHCLPFFPPAHPGSYLEERTYRDLLAPLGTAPTGSAECVFVDPIADIAVLGGPDNQALYDEAYEELLMNTVPLVIADAPKMVRVREPLSYGGSMIEVDEPGRGSARILSLSGEWIECTVTAWAKWLGVDQQELVAAGCRARRSFHWMAAQSALCRPVDRIRSSKRTSRRGSFADDGVRPGGKRPHC